MPALTRLIFPTQACINARMADTKNPFRRDREGVRSGERSMGACPFTRRRRTRPWARRPDFQRHALVTVAGLCRIPTGFADPTVL